MLIAGRSIQGIGAAGTFSMVFVIISDIVPPEKRGSYQGIINGVFALASIFGPLMGVSDFFAFQSKEIILISNALQGSFTDYVSWRWNFYIKYKIVDLHAVVRMFLRL